MKTTVISYSLTGNNDALAAGIASRLSAEHIRVTESEPRTDGKIAFDMLLNRTPAVNPIAANAADGGLVVFVAPVWMGCIAAPLRAPIRQFKAGLAQYAFVSISGGADGPNPKLAGEWKKRTGKEPAAVVNFLIADLLPSDPKPTRGVTSTYHLSVKDVKSLADKAVKILQEAPAAGKPLLGK